MKKLLSLSVLLMFVTFAVYAQSPDVKFEKPEYDFGSIKEADGVVTTTFTFTNNGDAPLILTKVTAGCGCTTTQWTQEPVLPNGTGEIKVAYNPTGRPGVFNKAITVLSNATTEPLVLSIKGEVTSRDLASNN